MQEKDQIGGGTAAPEFQTDHTRATAGERRRPTLSEQIEEMFTYHAPNEEQRKRYEVLRAAAKDFARTLISCTPGSADQTAAIRLLRECVMTANAAIALEGKL